MEEDAPVSIVETVHHLSVADGKNLLAVGEKILVYHVIFPSEHTVISEFFHINGEFQSVMGAMAPVIIIIAADLPHAPEGEGVSIPGVIVCYRQDETLICLDAVLPILDADFQGIDGRAGNSNEVLIDSRAS